MREEVELFFYDEAALLDEWRLDEWLELFTEDGRYIVPSTDRLDGDPTTTLALIADDITRIRSRVKQLMGKTVWAETPRSRTRRMISNVRVRRVHEDALDVAANFVVYRIRNERMDTYVGHYEYALVRKNGALKIRERKAILDLDVLRPHGKVSIIL